MAGALRWDVVCRVVDNYGDAGVAWRLARQLAVEHGERVTLWIDDPAPLARLVPGADPSGAPCEVDGVAVRRGPLAGDPPQGDVVVDAFGAGLPDSWVDAMASAPRAPAWIVLEYLSAEDWVDGAHRRASPEPRTGLARWFWCPGFTPHTGGLLHERDLLVHRDAFLAKPGRRATTLRALGVPAVTGARIALVFCYPTRALVDLFDAWSEDDAPTIALVPPGIATDAIDRWTGGRVPHPGDPAARGALTLVAVPFVAQRAFDEVLWSCDLAIVRGEDSFVRAQWAALPFAWHAYLQADDAHRMKVDAFLDRYLDGAPAAAAAAVRAFAVALAHEDGPALASAWPAFDRARDALAAHRRAWAGELASRVDLAAGLAGFARSVL